ncbi:hypothetical protein [Halovivax limisalsi]|uniref:hypothetical protein n=1 Tax=Halovivax limisalsi TaxID=1453760 RepID=UPI001FFD3A58|nr:hypothetical protein [Halovivax limisalsi]
MTDAYPDEPRDETGDVAAPWGRSGLVTGSIRSAVSRLASIPTLLVPFAAVAALITGIDRLRHRDPIPSVAWESVADSTIHVEYPLYPAPRSRTIRRLEALIDLEVPYLLWAIGLELLTIGAVAVAGVIVIHRALADAGIDSPPVRRRLGAYIGFVVAVDLVGRMLGGIGALDEMGLVLGVPVLIALLVVSIRLLLVPILLVAGRSLPFAIRRSNRLARGHGWSCLGVILIFGLGTWLLASVPIVGTFLTGLVIAPLQAVTLVAIYGRLSRGENRAASPAS